MYVVGYSLNDTTGDQQALLWVGHDCNPLLSFLVTTIESLTYVSGSTASFLVATNMPALVPAMASQQFAHGRWSERLLARLLLHRLPSPRRGKTLDEGIYDCVAVGICNTAC